MGTHAETSPVSRPTRIQIEREPEPSNRSPTYGPAADRDNLGRDWQRPKAPAPHFHAGPVVLPSLPMGSSPVELTVGGKTYRVVASEEEAVLQHLAAVVDSKLRDVSRPGRPVAPQAILLVAMTLAHELEEERARRHAVEQRAREMLTSVLQRIDAALEEADAVTKPSPEPPEPTRPDHPPPASHEA